MADQIEKYVLLTLLKAQDEVSGEFRNIVGNAQRAARDIEKAFGSSGFAKTIDSQTKGVEANMRRLAGDFKQLSDQLAAPRKSDIAKTLNAELEQTRKAFAAVSHEADPFAAALRRAETAQRALDQQHRQAAVGLKGFSSNLREVAGNQRLVASASADAAATLARELGGTLVTVGGHFGRLGGITTTFAQTLGRQMVRGTGEATSGLGALLHGTRLVARENEIFERTAARARASLNGEADAAIKSAAATRDMNVAKIAAQASVARMSISLGAAAAAFALSAASAVTLVATLKRLVGIGLDVSKAFDEVAVRMNPSISSMDRFRSAVFQLSSQTGVEVEKLASTLGNVLLHSTQDQTKALNLLEVATRTSIAAFSDTQRVATQLSDNLRSFGRSADDAQVAANAMLIAMRASHEEFEQIASAISQLAPLGVALGISLEEIAQAQAAVVKSGVPAQQAVFGLRLILSKLADPTSDVVEKLRLMGVRADEAAISQRGLIAVLKDIREVTGGSAKEIAKLFGESRVAGTAVALLTKGIGEMEEQARQLALGLDEAAESTENLFKQPGKALRNELNALRVAVEGLGAATSDVAGSSESTLQFIRDLATFTRIAALGIDEMVQSFERLANVLQVSAPVWFLLRKAIGGTLEEAREFQDLLDQQAASLKLVADLANAFAVARANAAAAPPPTLAGPSLREQSELIRDQIEQILRKTQTGEALFNDLSVAAGGAARDIAVVLGSLDAFSAHLAEPSVKAAEAAVAQAGAIRDAFAKIAEGFEENKFGAFREALAEALGGVDAADLALEDLGARIDQTGRDIERFAERMALALSRAQFKVDADREAEASFLSLGRALGVTEENLEKIRVQFSTFPAFKGDKIADEFNRISDVATGSKEKIAELRRLLTEAPPSPGFLNMPFEETAAGLQDFILKVNEAADALAKQGPSTAEQVRQMRFLASAVEATTLQWRIYNETLMTSGFAGGFEKGINDFVTAATDAFELGQSAAQQFSQSFTSSIETLILSIGTGKTSMREFAASVLQSIAQIIARLIALKIASTILGSLFGGAPAVFGPQVPAGFVPEVPTGDIGALRTFDRGGTSNFDFGGPAALRYGGVNTRPTLFMAPKRSGMTEAFVPLPGPNRGIPVEWRNGGPRGGSVGDINLSFNLVSQSLDPRTSADVIMATIQAKMPRVAEGLAAVIHGGNEMSLNHAIRGVGR